MKRNSSLLNLRFLYHLFILLACLPCTRLMASGKLPESILSDSLCKELPNGFRYVVKDNNKPANRIFFRLVMSVGSLQELPGEEGVAHFIEHLAFRNTVGFPNGGIVRKLESMGEKYGITINAYTGYDRTVYMFSIPAEVPEAHELGVRIVNEWMSHITFDEKAVSDEKPIIIEEIAGNSQTDCFDRLKKGADNRLHRLPIGTPEQVSRITPEVLKLFYERNYCPQNASLTIVGPYVETTKVDQLIKKTFGTLQGSASERTQIDRLKYDPAHLFERCMDENVRNASLDWIYPIPTDTVLTTRQLIAEKKNSFVLNMLNTHLQKKGNPLRISRQWYLNGTDHLCFEVCGANDSLLISRFAGGISIVQAIRNEGFSKHEIAMQLKAYRESEKNRCFQRTSEQWSDCLTDILLVRSRDVATPNESKLIAEALERTTPDEWNRVLKELLQPMDKKALAGYRFSPKLHRKLTYEDLEEVFSNARLHPDTTSTVIEIQQGTSRSPHRSSFLNLPVACRTEKAESTHTYPLLDIQEVCLRNGARLILKQTENADSLVTATLLFQGGLSLIPEGQYPLLESVGSYMSIGGIEGIDNEEYNQALVENSLSVINTMESYWHGMMASGKQGNVEQLANLLFLRCFSPQRAYSDFEEIKADLRIEKQNKECSAMSQFIAGTPERMIRKRMDELTENTPFSAQELTAEDVEKLDLDSIAAFYHRIYTCSTGLTCVVTGNFDMETTKRAFTAMLHRFGTQIPTQVKKNRRIIPQALPEEKVAEETQPGRLSFDYLYRGTFSSGLRETLTLKLMREIIRNRAIEEIRNNAGLIYSPYVDLYYHTFPTGTFCFDINGAVNTENAQAVKKEIERIMKGLQNRQPKQNELDAIKQSFLLTKDDFLQPDSPVNWRSYLTDCIKEQISLSDAENYELILRSITPEEISSAFKKLATPLQQTFLYTGNLDENKN